MKNMGSKSGKYAYKPLMSQTCCPQYTIRLSAVNYQPNKSHKKVLKKVQKFLQDGEVTHTTSDGISVEPMDSQADSPVSCNVFCKDQSEVPEDELKPLSAEVEETEKHHGEREIERDSEEAQKESDDPIETAQLKAHVHSMPKPDAPYTTVLYRMLCTVDYGPIGVPYNAVPYMLCTFDYGPIGVPYNAVPYMLCTFDYGPIGAP
ncbi:unnamed protein product [Ranitomeya imitator]|uniref:N-end aminoacyl transferase N-terminal domain-containing protein n=1 Tax=Ranitomeya imitator TaxID=111125 RepID=A0ABN9MM21_9NEOB|nr:unnamed protein product [Ranitomeya imitator]